MTKPTALAERLRDMPEVAAVEADDDDEPHTLDVALVTSDITDDVTTTITDNGGLITDVSANGSFALRVEIPGELHAACDEDGEIVERPVRTQGVGSRVVTIPAEAVDRAGFEFGDELSVGARAGEIRLSPDPPAVGWKATGDRLLRQQSRSYVITLSPDALDTSGFALGDVLRFPVRPGEIRMTRVAHQCRVCGDRFDSPEAVGEHMNDEHPNVNDHTASTAGEAHANSKLTESDVLEIRDRLDGDETHAEIAADYDVTTAAIGHIARGRRWTHVGRDDADADEVEADDAA